MRSFVIACAAKGDDGQIFGFELGESHLHSGQLTVQIGVSVIGKP